MLEMEQDDAILDLAIHYALHSCYSEGLSKEKKRAVRKRAARLVVERGEVFVQKKDRKVLSAFVVIFEVTLVSGLR